MEQAGSQHGISTTLDQSVIEITELAGPAGSDHRNGDAVGNGPGNCQVIATPGPVLIHAGQQDLTGSQGFDLGGPFEGIQARVARTAGNHDFKAARLIAADINGDYNALTAKTRRCFTDQFRILDSRGIE